MPVTNDSVKLHKRFCQNN